MGFITYVFSFTYENLLLFPLFTPLYRYMVNMLIFSFFFLFLVGVFFFPVICFLSECVDLFFLGLVSIYFRDSYVPDENPRPTGFGIQMPAQDQQKVYHLAELKMLYNRYLQL